MSEEEAYAENLMDHFEDPYNRGPLEGATHDGEGENPLCGDRIAVQLRLDPESGEIADAGFDGEGCVISQAAASILMETLAGMSFDQASELSAVEMLKLVDENLSANRRKCALLPWRVLQQALQNPIAFDEDGPTFGGPHLGEEN